MAVADKVLGLVVCGRGAGNCAVVAMNLARGLEMWVQELEQGDR